MKTSLVKDYLNDKQFYLFIYYLITYNYFNILSELNFNEKNIHYLINNINNELINDQIKQIINNIFWKIKEDNIKLDENLLEYLLKNYSWLLPSIGHHKPLLVMNYINNKNDTFIEYFKQLKICSLSVEFLNEILINEYFLKSIEELNQQIQYIINKTSNYLLIYHGLDYLIKISKYSNVQIWFSKTIIASNIWKYLLDIFNNPNISSFIQSPSILLTQLITLLTNLSIQSYLTEQHLEQDRPLRVDVIEFTFDNHILINDGQENKLITHKSIVENKDYPILLDRFVHANDVIHIVTQIDLISTSLPIPTTINNQTIIYDNDYQYYQDDIQQIESTTIQQLNTINNNNNNTNSNFWAKGTDSTHSQWKPDEIIQIQKFHEEHFIYLFDRFYSIFSNKLSEELLYDNLIEIINTSCLIPVLESYLRNDSILDISKQDENRMDIIKILITGPDSTPYSNGCFIFDLYFPNQYPTTPPSICL
ncbi:unnamed protein product [Rotaria sordida]|uniref:Uncharacterized protein n=3 Tax=Rotaria sordida TaxID=392033 RepID=A0A814D9N2_9BILA|nr:unnamed protein product [Rotaria sordida]